MHLKSLIPPALKTPLRNTQTAVLDGFDLLKKHDAMNPPRALVRKIGDGPFGAIGQHMFDELQTRTDLKPTDCVLDIGCGIGRVAMPLTRYLGGGGRYEGFDIMPDAIEWCQKQIAPNFPNFRFQLADIFNTFYNPSGRFRADEYVFPFEDATFDVIFLGSVFTHLLPAEVEHYLSEIARVLRPGGRCLFTIFLLNQNTETAIEAGKSQFKLRHRIEKARVSDAAFPEREIAHDESHIREICARLGLDAEVSYGFWSGAAESSHGHDFVLVRK